MNKKINIFLDDYRNPIDCTYMFDYKDFYLKSDFITVKDYASFKDLIDYCKENNTIIENISFDHDLIHSHYGLISYESIIDENDYTGYHACKYLLDNYTNEELKDTSVYIHTMSAFGLKNIIQLFYDRKLQKTIKSVTPVNYRC